MDAIKYVHEQMTAKREFPDFKPGDNIVVNYKIIEGDKERIQSYRGDVIQINGEGDTKTFTVRKISNGVGVERIFPFSSPNIVDIEITKRGKVRRAKLFYLRKLVGKKARIKEKKFTGTRGE
jgi:large subunit ribosomal protein L19